MEMKACAVVFTACAVVCETISCILWLCSNSKDSHDKDNFNKDDHKKTSQTPAKEDV